MGSSSAITEDRVYASMVTMAMTVSIIANLCRGEGSATKKSIWIL